MKALYRESTRFLTRRGFLTVSELTNLDEVGFINRKGEVGFTNQFTVVKEKTEISLLGGHTSYIFCNKDLFPYISTVYKYKKFLEPKEESGRTAVVNGLSYELLYSDFLATNFLLLNYASFDPTTSLITYEHIKNNYHYNTTFYAVSDKLNKIRTGEGSGFISFSFNRDLGRNEFTSDSFIFDTDKFINVLLNNIGLTLLLFKRFRMSGLIYTYDHVRFCLNCKDKELSLILLFLLTLTGCAGSIKSHRDTDRRGNNEIHMVISFFCEENIKLNIYSYSTIEDAVGIMLDENISVGLITSTNYKGYDSIMYGPSYTNN